MQLALLTDVFRRMDVHRAIAAAAAAGFTALELNACYNWDPHVNLEAADWRREITAVERTAASHGVRIPVVACYPNLAATNRDERDRAIEYCARGMEACAMLGGGLITVMPGGNNLLPTGPQQGALISALSALCEVGSRQHVAIAIESYPGNCVEGTADLAGLVRRLGCPHLGYLLCTAHLAARGEDLVRAYDLSQDVLRHVHLSDSRTATPSHEHLIPGLGDIPLTCLVERLQADGYTGLLSLQIYSHAMEAEEAAVRALIAVQQFCHDGRARQ